MHVLAPDLTGQRFGRLTVMYPVIGWGPRLRARWVCQCDCGGETIALAGHLRYGMVRSCGCLRREHSKRQMAIVNAATSADWRSLLATLRSEVVTRTPQPPRCIKEALRDTWGECQDRRFWRALQTLVARGQVVRSGKPNSSEDDIGSVYSLPRRAA